MILQLHDLHLYAVEISSIPPDRVAITPISSFRTEQMVLSSDNDDTALAIADCLTFSQVHPKIYLSFVVGLSTVMVTK